MKRFPGKKLLAVLLAVVCLPLTAFAAFAVGQGRAARSGVSVVVDGGRVTIGNEYISDVSGALHGRGLGSDPVYAETVNGLSLTLTAPVDARYVRVYMCGSSSGNTNHVNELEVLGP